MLKKIKWLLLGVASILIIVVAYIVSLVRYAQTEVTALNNYTASLLTLPEVASVGQIHRFNGLASYIVASIELDNGQDVYYFVRDGTVAYYFFSVDLINEHDAIGTARNLVRTGEVIHTQLGILSGTPIFEVQIEDKDERVVHYIIIDAKTRELIIKFDT